MPQNEAALAMYNLGLIMLALDGTCDAGHEHPENPANIDAFIRCYEAAWILPAAVYTLQGLSKSSLDHPEAGMTYREYWTEFTKSAGVAAFDLSNGIEPFTVPDEIPDSFGEPPESG